MNVGEFFTLKELTRTDQPFPNEPELFHVINLTRLICKVGDPLRMLAGKLNTLSCFRSHKVNTAVGGAENSYHMQGLAMDIYSDEHSPMDLAKMLGGLEFDLAIVYETFMHIQIAAIGEPPRGKILKGKEVNGKMTYTEIF